MPKAKASEVVVLAAEFLFRKDRYGENDYSSRLCDEMSFAEDELRKHPLVAKQLSFYQADPDEAPQSYL